MKKRSKKSPVTPDTQEQTELAALEDENTTLDRVRAIADAQRQRAADSSYKEGYTRGLKVGKAHAARAMKKTPRR